MKTNLLFVLLLIVSSKCFSGDHKSVLIVAEKVFDWQQKHPTGVDLWEWEYGTYYSGLIDLYKIDPKSKYLKAMLNMGKKRNWYVKPKPYDADVLAITHMYLDLYSIKHNPKMIDKALYCLDANLIRHPKEADVRRVGNKYWWSWWSWCDALFMAPPAFAKYSKISGELKYLDKMNDLWLETYKYLYDKDACLFYRDDRYFNQISSNGEKVFWSRGNGWVMGGLVKVLESMPKDYSNRQFYENLFKEMAHKIKLLQLKDGYWASSLLDPNAFKSVELSGTAFFCYALTYGINSGLLNKNEYETTVLMS